VHQDINEDEISPAQRLVNERNDLLNSYRGATQHAVRALDYYQRFKRVEDWEDSETQESVKTLQSDSRRFLKEVAIDIRRMRNRLDIINEALMNLAVKKQKKEKNAE